MSKRFSSSVDPQIEAEVQRYRSLRNLRCLALRFQDKLERRFLAETAEARMLELRLTLPLSILCYMVTTATDQAWVPDIGRTGFYLRIAGALPLLIPLSIGHRLSSRFREAMMTVCSVVAIGLLSAIPAISHAPTACFGFGMAGLAVVYANTTFPLRFVSAVIVSAICFAVMFVEIFACTMVAGGLAWAMVLQIAIGAFSVLTSYRMERSLRLSYLLSAREAVRLSALTVDNELLLVLSDNDALTGVSNRGCFDRRSAQAFANPENTGVEASVMMLDVDHFKMYNDHYGHIAGDMCLKAIAKSLSDTFSNERDILARYGGEEFVIMLFGVSSSAAELIARRVCKTIASLGLEHLNRDDGLKVVTISVGLVNAMVDGVCSPSALVEAADRALYIAKKRRNSVECVPRIAA